ncbi:uncharacterized protein LOC144513914 [Sander vitreus]
MGPTDTYGCTRFQPSLPAEETEDTMETKRQQLEGIYSQDGTAGAERLQGYATAADLESSLSLPATPRLILLGETGNRFQRWMLSTEGQIVCEGIQSNFVTGLASFFSCFYIFNLQYQEETACTLEFIQRRKTFQRIPIVCFEKMVSGLCSDSVFVYCSLLTRSSMKC